MRGGDVRGGDAGVGDAKGSTSEASEVSHHFFPIYLSGSSQLTVHAMPHRLWMMHDVSLGFCCHQYQHGLPRRRFQNWPILKANFATLSNNDIYG